MKKSRALTVAMLGAALVLPTACGKSSSSSSAGGTWEKPSASAAPEASTSPSSAAPEGKPVHVRLLQGDGSTWGIGMPIIAYLSVKFTDAKEFAAASPVTVNGEPAGGAWYFHKSAIYQ